MPAQPLEGNAASRRKAGKRRYQLRRSWSTGERLATWQAAEDECGEFVEPRKIVFWLPIELLEPGH